MKRQPKVARASQPWGDFYPASDGHIYDGFGSGTDHFDAGLPRSSITQFRLYDVTTQPSLWQSRLDGNSQTASATNSVSFSTTPLLGKTDDYTNGQPGFSGDIAEVLIYDHVLSVAERRTVQQYLGIKYLLPGFDIAGDGLTTAQKLALGLNPYTPNGYGDGLWDGIRINLDATPADPLYPDPSGPPAPYSPAPTAGSMVITLTEPAGATLLP